jgi:hypothetical protein
VAEIDETAAQSRGRGRGRGSHSRREQSVGRTGAQCAHQLQLLLPLGARASARQKGRLICQCVQNAVNIIGMKIGEFEHSISSTRFLEIQ